MLYLYRHQVQATPLGGLPTFERSVEPSEKLPCSKWEREDPLCYGLIKQQKPQPDKSDWGFVIKNTAMTYSPTQSPVQYHRR